MERGSVKLINPIILDNLIPKSYQVDLAEKIAYSIPYNFQSVTAMSRGTNYDICIDNNTIDSLQFVHYALLDGTPSEVLSLIRPMLYFVEERLNRKISDVGRVKINCLTRNRNSFTKDNYNVPHTDDPNPDLLSLIYYVNDSDGDTFFFNEAFGQTQNGLTLNARVSPLMGRAVIFDSRRFHAGSNPIESPSRFVINVTLKLENEKQTLETVGQSIR
jgi:hypothetical protein